MNEGVANASCSSHVHFRQSSLIAIQNLKKLKTKIPTTAIYLLQITASSFLPITRPNQSTPFSATAQPILYFKRFEILFKNPQLLACSYPAKSLSPIFSSPPTPLTNSELQSSHLQPTTNNISRTLKNYKANNIFPAATQIPNFLIYTLQHPLSCINVVSFPSSDQGRYRPVTRNSCQYVHFIQFLCYHIL